MVHRIAKSGNSTFFLYGRLGRGGAVDAGHGGGHAIVDAEFSENMVQVVFHRVHADAEDLRDLLV